MRFFRASRFCILLDNVNKFLNNVKGMEIRKNLAINFLPLNRCLSRDSEEMKLENRISHTLDILFIFAY